MPVYAIVNKDTKAFDHDCSYCGITSISGRGIDDQDIVAFESAERDEDHMLVELTNAEVMNLVRKEYTIAREGKEYKTEDLGELEYHEREAAVSSFKYALDAEKAAGKIDEREKIEVPIEMDGPNGKEIIGYEQKPISIVVERSKPDKEPEVNSK